MSARVFNPLVLSEMRRMIGRSSSDASPAAVARVRRDLFGPVNHEDAQAFVDRELASMRKREMEKWGFDFARETPLDNTRFRWERVSPEENIPEAYALRRLSFMNQQTSTAEPPASDAPTNAVPITSHQEQTTMKGKPSGRQSQITDYLKCRKRSLSAGDISLRKVGSGGAGQDISLRKVGSGGAGQDISLSLSHSRTAAPGPAPSKIKRARTRTRQ